MDFRVCCVPVSTMRKEPSHRGEIVSQQLFGERSVLLDTTADGWQKIKGKYDGYEGWVQKSNLTAIDEEKYQKEDNMLTSDWVNEVDYNGHVMHVPLGCTLSAFQNGHALWSRNSVKFKGNSWDAGETIFSEKILKQVAFKFLNTAYLWGGKSVFGIDCSGFVQSVFKFFNIRLPRDAWQQAEKGETVNFLQEVKFGDVAFFDNEEGRITHVGILLNGQEIIHSSGKVRIDKIDSQGICTSDTNERTHQLRIIKRFTNEI